MKTDAKPFALRTACKAALAVLLSCSILFSLLLASNPGLHRALHTEAGHAQHQCLAVLLSGGGVEGATATAILIAFIAGLVRKHCPETPQLPSTTLDRLLPGRAPPLALS